MNQLRPAEPGIGRGPVAGVILAAGRSTRMGRPKALLPLPDGTVISRLVGAFDKAGVAPIHVVVGHRGGEIAASLSTLPVNVVWNDLHPLGQTTSLQAGLRSLPDGTSGALLSPVDYPLITPAEITPLLHAFQKESHASVFLPRHLGRRGHPFLIAADCFKLFLDLPAGEPGRGVVKALANRVYEVDVPSDAVLLDIDRPGDYCKVLSRLKRT